MENFLDVGFEWDEQVVRSRGDQQMDKKASNSFRSREIDRKMIKKFVDSDEKEDEGEEEDDQDFLECQRCCKRRSLDSILAFNVASVGRRTGRTNKCDCQLRQRTRCCNAPKTNAQRRTTSWVRTPINVPLDLAQIESLSLSHLYESLRMQEHMDRKQTLDVIFAPPPATVRARNGFSSGDAYRRKIPTTSGWKKRRALGLVPPLPQRLYCSKSDLDVRYAPFGTFTSELEKTKITALPRINPKELIVKSEQSKERSWSAI